MVVKMWMFYVRSEVLVVFVGKYGLIIFWHIRGFCYVWS